jgi:2-polyprenyl-3-methyl-5-hydroxy-6-metoxy-1,4-benzoquinol methylase
VIDQLLYPHLKKIVDAVVGCMPSQERFLGQSFAARGVDLMRQTEQHAAIIYRIVGSPADLARFALDYRFLCETVLEEEIFFRREGRYRLSKFEDAYREVYANRQFMDRYMNFILLSHVLWENHARAMSHFEHRYLPSLPPGTRHLEIGPGHGLLLHFASNVTNIASVTGWDVSETSIDQARHCLKVMGEKRSIELTLQDLFAAPTEIAGTQKFGSVVMAEVLEHLEDPVAAMRAVSRHMIPGGMLWIHVPINSPAPDHLYLLRTPEEAVELVQAGGFEPIDTAFYPMSGQTLERARKRTLTISAVITARLR